MTILIDQYLTHLLESDSIDPCREYQRKLCKPTKNLKGDSFLRCSQGVSATTNVAEMWIFTKHCQMSFQSLTWSCDPWYWLRRLWGWCQQSLFFSPCKSRTSLLQQNLHNFIITSQFNFTLFMANYGVLKFDSFSLDCPVNSASRALTIRNNQTLIYYRNIKHFKARNLYPHTCTSCHLLQ